jgi:transmembrane sensor
LFTSLYTIMNDIYFHKLVKRCLSGDLDTAEEIELGRLLEDDKYKKLFGEILSRSWNQNDAGTLHPEIQRVIEEDVLTRINHVPAKNKAVINISIVKWIAAASIVIILIGSSFWFYNNQLNSAKLVKNNVPVDVNSPQVAKATLRLADGSELILDAVSQGNIADQGTSSIIKSSDGNIIYKNSGIKTSNTLYNTLFVPRGSKVVSLTLDDGTRVWLNAESSLRYPVVFNEKSRDVEVEGEAYFEVSKDKKRKFIVKSDKATTEVLGTHFNINTYEKLQGVDITLLEGNVNVSNNLQVENLKPGQLARIRNNDIRLTNNADIDVIMAWKNGQFNFADKDLKSIMQQLARWYNVEVVYEGINRSLNFGGQISRKEKVSAVLELLEMTGVVKFKVVNSGSGYSAKIIVQYL